VKRYVSEVAVMVGVRLTNGYDAAGVVDDVEPLYVGIAGQITSVSAAVNGGESSPVFRSLEWAMVPQVGLAANCEVDRVR
jgi:hypothetical protein